MTKWDYLSWDKNGNPVISSRSFMFRKAEVVINEDHIYVGLYDTKSDIKNKICNNLIHISSGKFTLDTYEDRLIVQVLQNKNWFHQTDTYYNGIYVVLKYYVNVHKSFYLKDDDIQKYYIMSQWAYDRENKYVGITKKDIDSFYDTMQQYAFIDIPKFKTTVDI